MPLLKRKREGLGWLYNFPFQLQRLVSVETKATSKNVIKG